MCQREFRYARRLPTLLSPSDPRLRGRPPGAQTRFCGDVYVDKVLCHLHYLRNQLKKLDLKSRMPLKWQLNLKLRRSLKDTILKMEIPMRRAHYCIGRSKCSSSIVMGNHDEWEDDHEEIATSYVESGESYYRKTTIVDIYFASKIIGSMDPDPN